MMKIVWALLFFSDFCGAYDQKPEFHITPPNGHWLNDPNGPIYFEGKYHLFYQYNPFGSDWGNMSWGHVTSSDLIHWKQLDVALWNDKAYDIGGVFSGSAFFDATYMTNESTPAILYTCVDANNVELQCLAYVNVTGDLNSDLPLWEKSASNPVIGETPSSWDKDNFRDPALFLSDSGDVFLIAAASVEGQGVVVAYVAKDSSLEAWEYAGVTWNSHDSPISFHTWMVECPDIFPVMSSSKGSKDSIVYPLTSHDLFVLKYSVMETRQEFYEVGLMNLVNGVPLFKTTSTELKLYDYGPNNSFYASKTFWDPVHQQRLLWGWSPEQDKEASSRGWQGVQSVPRTTKYDAEAGILRFQPASALQALRSEPLLETKVFRFPAALSVVQLVSSSPLALEVHVNFSLLQLEPKRSLADWTAEVGLRFRQSVDGEVYSVVGLEVKSTASVLSFSTVLDTSLSGGTTPALRKVSAVPGSTGGVSLVDSIDLTLLLDHSMVEVFAMDGASASTLRVYPNEANSALSLYCLGDQLFCQQTTATVTVWPMKSIW